MFFMNKKNGEVVELCKVECQVKNKPTGEDDLFEVDNVTLANIHGQFNIPKGVFDELFEYLG
jgi:hypothetical protein